MKQKLFFFFAIFFLAFFSCEKEETQLPEPQTSDPQVLLDEEDFNMDEAIILTPEGSDFDTRNLRAAVTSQKKSGRFTFIYLSEGVYYLDVMEFRDFNGIIMGAGMGKTIVKPIKDGINYPDPKRPFWFDFKGGNIVISNLSFEVLEDAPSRPYESFTGTETYIASVIAIMGSSPDNNIANSVIRNVSFKGKYLGPGGKFIDYNLNNCITYNAGGTDFTLFSGYHAVQRCKFETCDAGIGYLVVSDANILVGGSPHMRNYFKDMNYGVFYIAMEKSNIRVSHNIMKDILNVSGFNLINPPVFAYGDMTPIPLDGNNRFIIQNNLIELSGSIEDGRIPAVHIEDFLAAEDPSKNSKFYIRNNTIKMNEPEHCAIYGFGLTDSDIKNNSCTGSSKFAMKLDGPSGECKLIMNRFIHYSGSMASIILGEDSYNNKVIGKAATTTVEDHGSDNYVMLH
jgi:hypothetical protein